MNGPFHTFLFRSAASLLLLCGTATAAIRSVTNLNDSGSGSLRATIAASSSGDTIRFAVTGTIALTSGTLVARKSLVIEGPGDPAVLHITQSAAAGTPGFQIFDFYTSGTPFTVRLSRLTISKGRASNGGGGAVFAGADLTVTDCVFDDNSASLDGGGAINHWGGGLEVTNCVFRDNFAAWTPLHDRPGAGGAISSQYSDRAHVYTNTVFTGNNTQLAGGAIALDGESGVSLTVNGCTFSSNESQSGGAIYATCETDNSTLTITQSTFSGNAATSSGGACVADFGSTTVRSSLFSGNSASDGGGVYNWRTLTVENSTFSGNSSLSTLSLFGGGGAIYNRKSLVVRSCTFAGNMSQRGGGAIHQAGLPTTSSLLGNNILDHRPNSGPSLGSDDGTITSQGYNLCGDNGSGFLTAAGDLLNTDPRFDTRGLQNNGGPTKTIALLSTGPALDGGKSFGLTTDQRGRQRPLELSAHANAAGGDGSDIGAYESGDPLQPSPVVVTTLHDHDDGVAGEGDCTLREAIARVNALESGGISFLNGLQGTLTLDRNIGPLIVTGRADITGPGARVLAISAAGYMRVFYFSGSSSGGSLSGLTIRDGSTVAVTAVAGVGGGVSNDGTLICNDCAFQAHSVRGRNGTTVGGHGTDGYGGGIYNAGQLTLNRCTFTGCLAAGGYGMDDFTPDGVGIPLAQGGNGGTARGGAIYHGGGSLTVNQCTFQGNNASGGVAGNGGRFGGGGGNGQGGAIFCQQGSAQITSSTVVGNYSFGGSGGDGSTNTFDGPNGVGSGAVTGGNSGIRSTLIGGNFRSANLPADVGGSFSSGGYNFIGSADGATGLTQATDQKGTNAAPLNPMVAPLQNNGGHTNTMAPLAGSPLIDKGKSFGLTTDQRGLSRPLDALSIPNPTGGDASEIGSVETDVAQTGPEFVVNTLDDHDDGDASYLDCSLREALNAAFDVPGADTVRFQPGMTGIIGLNPALGGLTMYDPVTLIGPGARRLTVRWNTGVTGRVLLVQGGPHYLSGLTLTGGSLIGNTGGQSVSGAGILTQGVLTVSDCSIFENIATGGDNNVDPDRPGGSAVGGGVANLGGGILTLNRCNLARNSVYGGRGFQDASSSSRGGDASGGAVYNGAGCTLMVVNCTFSDNSASGGNSGNASSFAGVQGGAGQGVLCNFGNMTITAATVAGGFGAGGASSFIIPRGAGIGGIFAAPGSSSLVRNTLCAANTGNFVPSDIGGAFTSGGFNLIGNGDTGTGFTAASDQKGTASAPLNPRFGGYFNYGGPTDTAALQPDSPALDRGKNFDLDTDQRGAARTYDDPALVNAAGGDGTDIGAYETHPDYSGPLVFVSSNMAGTAVQFQVQGQRLVSYQLQSSSSLTGSFTNVGAARISDNLGLVDFTDPGPLPQRRFYKAVQSP